jgi:hypothetical protein
LGVDVVRAAHVEFDSTHTGQQSRASEGLGARVHFVDVSRNFVFDTKDGRHAVLSSRAHKSHPHASSSLPHRIHDHDRSNGRHRLRFSFIGAPTHARSVKRMRVRVPAQG